MFASNHRLCLKKRDEIEISVYVSGLKLIAKLLAAFQ